VARLLGDAPRSVEYWVHRLEQRGLSGWIEGERSGRPSRLSQKQMQEIHRVLRAKPSDAGMRVNLWDGKSLSAWIEKQYGIPLGVRQCQRLFRQFEFRLRKPRPVLARADPARQKAHKKNSGGGCATIRSTFGLSTKCTFNSRDLAAAGGVPPEIKDPVVYHHPTRKSVGYFGAVRLRDGQFLFHRQTERFNGETFWEFLKIFRQASVDSSRRVVAISDHAQYHRSKLHQAWRHQQAPRFSLDFLPPYSPELNPIERVWKLPRSTLSSQPLLWIPR
jgi:transposase